MNTASNVALTVVACLSLVLNIVVLIGWIRASNKLREYAGMMILNRELAAELERKYGNKKAARIIRSTVNNIKQKTATKGV